MEKVSYMNIGHAVKVTNKKSIHFNKNGVIIKKHPNANTVSVDLGHNTIYYTFNVINLDDLIYMAYKD
jgi:hypothetical protein